jgi:hypothetical protein
MAGKGVKQGDIMAPILFLFLMLAFSETLEEKYEEWGIKPIEFKYHADITKGQLKSQTLQCRALTFRIIQLLYVDDTFFPFTTRDDLIQGTNQIFHLFRCFGPLVHIGKGETDSKLKAIYVQPSLPKKTSEPTNESTITTAFDTTSSHDSPTNSSTTISNTTPKPIDSDSNSNPLYILPTPYDVADGFISFTVDPFLYLGTLITPDLRDKTDVRSRIKKATAQVSTLRTFFWHPDIDLETKTTVYTTTAFNTVLWGCKAWTVTDSIKCALQVFHHHSLRNILNINMFKVEEQRITNAQTQKCANIPDILIFLMRRSLRWIGKLYCSKNANEQTAPPTSCHLGQKPMKKRKTTVHPMQHHDRITP